MLTYDAFSFIQVTFLLFIFVGLGSALMAERPTPLAVRDRRAAKAAPVAARRGASADADRGGTRMRVLITGSSGQIGTNLGLRLLRRATRCSASTSARTPWTDAFPTLLQDLAGHYPAFPGGIGGVEYPEVDIVVHLAAHAKVHQLVAQPHRALENAVMTFNVLEYCRALGCRSSSRRRARSTATCAGSRATARRQRTSPSRRARTRHRRSQARHSIYSYARCYDLPYLVFRFSNVYGRYDNDLHRMVRVLPLFTHLMLDGERVTVFGRDKVLDFTYVDDCVDGIARGVEALGDGTGTERDDQSGVRRGQHALPAAELIAEQLGVEPQIDTAPARLGEVTHYIADIRKAHDLLGWRPADVTRRGDPEIGRLVPRTSSRASGGSGDDSERGCQRRLEGTSRRDGR